GADEHDRHDPQDDQQRSAATRLRRLSPPPWLILVLLVVLVASPARGLLFLVVLHGPRSRPVAPRRHALALFFALVPLVQVGPRHLDGPVTLRTANRLAGRLVPGLDASATRTANFDHENLE